MERSLLAYRLHLQITVLPLDSKQKLFAEPFVGAFEKSVLGKVTKCDVQTFACFQATAAVQMRFTLFWAFYAAQNGIVSYRRFGTTYRVPVFKDQAVV